VFDLSLSRAILGEIGEAISYTLPGYGLKDELAF